MVGLGIEAKKSRKEEATQERRRHNKAQHAQRQAHARRRRLGSKGKHCPSLSSCSPSPLGIHSPRSILCGRRRRRTLPVPLFRCAVLAVSLAVTASPSRPHAGRGTRAHTQAGRPHTSVACGGQRERGSAGIGTRKRATRQVKTRGGGCAQHHETRGGSSDNVRGAGQRVRPAAPLSWWRFFLPGTAGSTGQSPQQERGSGEGASAEEGEGRSQGRMHRHTRTSRVRQWRIEGRRAQTPRGLENNAKGAGGTTHAHVRREVAHPPPRQPHTLSSALRMHLCVASGCTDAAVSPPWAGRRRPCNPLPHASPLAFSSRQGGAAHHSTQTAVQISRKRNS